MKSPISLKSLNAKTAKKALVGAAGLVILLVGGHLALHSKEPQLGQHEAMSVEDKKLELEPKPDGVSRSVAPARIRPQAPSVEAPALDASKDAQQVPPEAQKAGLIDPQEKAKLLSNQSVFRRGK